MSIVYSNPAVLKWAGEQSGFNSKEVAEKLKRKKVTAQTITAWERGAAFPSYSQLDRIIRLNLSIDSDYDRRKADVNSLFPSSLPMQKAGYDLFAEDVLRRIGVLSHGEHKYIVLRLFAIYIK